MINVIKIQQSKGEKGYQRRCYFIEVGWGDLSEEVPFEQRLKDRREQDRQVSGRSVFQAKAAQGAKVFGMF